jgi:hypothetical protein
MPGRIEVSAGKGRMIEAVAVSTKHQVHSAAQAGIVKKEGVDIFPIPRQLSGRG